VSEPLQEAFAFGTEESALSPYDQPEPNRVWKRPRSVVDHAPGRARRDDYATSRAGAESVKYRAGSQKAKLLAAFASSAGLTDEQAATQAGLSMRSCFWKRCGELRDAGLIIFTGEQRVGSSGTPCGVSEITTAGRVTASDVV
jgi:hypothetical protein